MTLADLDENQEQSRPFSLSIALVSSTRMIIAERMYSGRATVGLYTVRVTLRYFFSSAQLDRCTADGTRQLSSVLHQA